MMRNFYQDEQESQMQTKSVFGPSEDATEGRAFYITTTLPYVNSDPHLGFALEIIHADIIARYHRLLGERVIFNTGTDEHGTKIYRKATEEGKTPQAYVDKYAAKFDSLRSALNLTYTNFIRTTDSYHKLAAQEFWTRCYKNGYIEKGIYKQKYCVGCELDKTDSELVDGNCPIHPNLAIEIIEEENYFFKFSEFKDKLLTLYENVPNFVVPDFRFNEIKKFVEGGLSDFSISRLKSKMPWGVPIPIINPGDEQYVMYVWFDALVNYISTLGWPCDGRDPATDTKALLKIVCHYDDFWPGYQVAGKDNLRQQSAMWQAMLMAAELPPSKQIVIHGFITSAGQKMSKSLGNVVDPFEIVKKYGTDALRYWCAKEANTFEDSDFDWDKFKDSYNADLANGLGNLASRVTKMAMAYGVAMPKDADRDFSDGSLLASFQIKAAAEEIWKKIRQFDAFIQRTEPFKKIKTNPEEAKKDVEHLLLGLYDIAYELQPFLPDTAKKIIDTLKKDKVEAMTSLFPRVE